MPTKKINKFDVDETIAKQEEVNELKDALSEKISNKNGTHTGDLNLISNGGAIGAVGSGYILRYNADKSEMTYAQVFPSDEKTNLAKRFRLYTYANNKETGYNIYGEHNKPSGSYTGNGSATERKIETGSVGRLIYLYNQANGYGAIAWGNGALLFHGSTVTTLGGAECNVSVSGVITLNTDNVFLNQNGATIIYYAL